MTTTITNDLSEVQRKRMAVLSVGLGLMGTGATALAARLLVGALLLLQIDYATQRDEMARQLVYGVSGLGMLTFGLTFLYLCRKVWLISRGERVSL